MSISYISSGVDAVGVEPNRVSVLHSYQLI